jgi:hypothetical protein
LRQESDRRKGQVHNWLICESSASTASYCDIGEIHGFHTKDTGACLSPGLRKSSHGAAKLIIFGVNLYYDNHIGGNNGDVLAVRSAGLQAAKTGTAGIVRPCARERSGCGDG